MSGLTSCVPNVCIKRNLIFSDKRKKTILTFDKFYNVLQRCQQDFLPCHLPNKDNMSLWFCYAFTACSSWKINSPPAP